MSKIDTPYEPTTRPPTQDVEVLARWIEEEFREIARALRAGILRTIRGDRWYQYPPRPELGDLAFLDGSIGQGGATGWHEYSSQGGGSWQKL